MLGNLAGAAKGAAAKVRVSGRRDDAVIVLSVKDHGPGVPEDRIGIVLARGGRLDEIQPGSELGLATVGDVADPLRRSALDALEAITSGNQATESEH